MIFLRYICLFFALFSNIFSFAEEEFVKPQETGQPAIGQTSSPFTSTPLNSADVPQRIESIAEKHAFVELLSENVSIVPGQPFWLGVQINLDKGWHTYWQNAGDTGFAAQFKWELPKGFNISQPLWPAPERIKIGNMLNYGFHDKVIVLFEVTPPSDLVESDIFNIGVSSEFLICEKICLPMKEHAQTQVIASAQEMKNNAISDLFEATGKRLPQTLLADIRVRTYKDNYYIIIPKDQSPAQPLAFIPMQEDLIVDSADQTPYNSDNLIVLPVRRDTYNSKEPLSQLEGLLTSGNHTDGAAYIIRAEVAHAAPPTPDIFSPENTDRENRSVQLDSLLIAVGFAFIAGMILNLMPCVLPVLAFKVTSLVKNAKQSKSRIIKHGLVFTFGVLITFWALALALIALKEGGSALGWGFHLQSPTFVGLLSLLLLLVALDFFGVFEVGTSLTQLENVIHDKRGYIESFMSGLLITLIATPCTVPFMGSAVSFGLTHSSFDALAVFTSMGLGLALPYVLLSVSPWFLRFIPRPGAWMVTFRQLMGFPILASCLWLLWVFYRQTDADAMFQLLAGLFLASFGAWAYGRMNQLHAGTIQKTIGLLLFASTVAAGAYFAQHVEQDDTINNPNGNNMQEADIFTLSWKPWSKQAVDDALADNMPVLVNFTADWCITCKYNDLRVFNNNKAVDRILLKNNVQLFKGDWTVYDPEITKELAEFGRKGVPLYVFYPHGKKSDPVLLPQILNEGIILDLFK